ncbi:ATP-binding protein [Methanolacinia petrolearia]|uniref:ATP-binding protein n=1 Tax=Methanolacinia petrolearia TaxID=54120 RepID=UPI003BAD77E2
MIVSVYPKSLEIYNTGSFPEGVTPDKLSEGHISVLRNPDIAHVVYLRGLMEKTGRGSVLIRRSCEEHGLPLPKWTSDQNSVTLTFFAPEEKKVSETRIQIGGMPWVHTIIPTTDVGFLIGGSYSDSESFPHSRPWVAKTDDNGSLLWENKFGSVNDSFIGFYESEDGKYHIIYASQLTGENGPDRDQYIETVIDNNGKLASTNNDNVPGCPKLISKDGLVFTETISCTDGGKKLHIIKTNAEGETEWDSLCELADSSATSSSIGSGIVRTADGGYLITGARYYY